MYEASLNGVAMDQLSDQYTSARAAVAAARTHDWRRGFTYTYLLLAAAIWLLTFLALVVLRPAPQPAHPGVDARDCRKSPPGTWIIAFPSAATTKSDRPRAASTTWPTSSSNRRNAWCMSRASKAGRAWRAKWRMK